MKNSSRWRPAASSSVSTASRVNFALMSGGGLKTGQVIGTTDAQAGEAKSDAIPYPNVLATTYHALGIDPHAMVTDGLPPRIGRMERVGP